MTDYISLKELCDMLSISVPTGKNWIKLQKLTPEYTDQKTPYFSREYATKLKKEIQTGKNKALKSRRNKAFISGNSLYNSYVSENSRNLPVLQELLNRASNLGVDFSPETIQYLVADCALQLFLQKAHIPYEENLPLLHSYLTGTVKLEKYDILICALISDRAKAIAFCGAYPDLFCLKYYFETMEDTLGLLYISCKNIGNRKASGTYFTPTKVVKGLISSLTLSQTDKILDPCCGTGNFLLQLPDSIPFEKIYGNDLDSTSVKITRINMALKYGSISVESILSHITQKNYLTEYTEESFQHILGNPPWGYDFTEGEKRMLRRQFDSVSGKNIESYDLFIERALKNLSLNGQVSFVLPEAVLNVKAHSNIRKIIIAENSVNYIEFLGNVFDGVQCPCIILQIQHTCTPISTAGLKIKTPSKTVQILTNRHITPDYFNFSATDEEYHVLEKIRCAKNVSFLANNADFALGIVTGNNKKYISSQKNGSNEMILRGADICKYHISSSKCFIEFKPENFQQVAPIKLYRAPEKLLYRFISSQLVFAYDDKQTLSLNSCNIVIPKIDNLHIKYILAVLNSRVAQFIYKREFHSVKVLRTHIEDIPLPNADAKTQETVIQIVNQLISGMDLPKMRAAYEELDQIIFHLFALSPNDQEIIKNAVDKRSQ